MANHLWTEMIKIYRMIKANGRRAGCRFSDGWVFFHSSTTDMLFHENQGRNGARVVLSDGCFQRSDGVGADF